MAYADAEVFANSIGTVGSGTLASDPGSGGTTLTLTTGHGARFPAVLSGQRLRLQIESEILIVTAHTANADTMTVTRGAEGSTAAAHSALTAVNAVLTKEAMERYAPSSVAQPRHHKLLGWTMPPYAAASNVSFAAGVAFYSKVRVAETCTFATVHWHVSVAAVNGGASIANSFLGVYNSAGTRLGVTADQSTTFQSTGLKSAALTVDGGQSLTVTGGPDVYVYVAVLIGTQATTAGQARGSSSQSVNLGLVAADGAAAGTAGSGLSALPSSVTPSTMSTNAQIVLAGLS
jgi:hypothetical protein